MPSIQSILDKYKDDIGQAVRVLSVDTMEYRTPIEYKEEYDGERRRRRSSVGWREDKRLEQYSDTLKQANGDPVRLDDKIVRVAKIVTNFPRKLVRTDTAMMFGGNMKITADNQDDGFAEFKRIWTRVLGMQDVLIEFAEKVLSETKSAIVFYPIIHERWTGEKISEINCKILSIPRDKNALYEFYPHFNGGKMDGFIHRYHITDADNMIREQAVIYTREKIITATQSNGGWEVVNTDNLFGLVPIVYSEVDEPAWEESASTLDAREMRLSRMADTNDYFAEPIMKTYGEADLPGKNTVGKEICFPIKVDSDTGKDYHGDADFLSWQQSIDSVEKELDTNKDEMFSGASLPDLSFDNLKGIGTTSGVARKFMMLDAEIKSKINMRTFRPALMRCVTIVTAGIANITAIKYKQQLAKNWITVSFDSILPKDPTEDAQILSIANGGKAFNSQQTVVANSPLTPPGDVDGELERMAEDAKKEAIQNNMIGLTGF